MNTIKKLIQRLLLPKDIISFRESMNLTEMPIITLYQGDKKFNFLLDTGATQSIIDGNILDTIDHTVVNKKSTVYGFEGNPKEVSICKITLSYKDRDYEYEYLTCDMKNSFDNLKKETGVTLHGIIGSKFFNEFKYILDFDELIAYSKS